MNFGIGSAQFDAKYGFLKKKLDKKDLIKILSNFDTKLKYIDTSPSYNNAEVLIGNFLKNKVKIISKINSFKFNNIEKNISEFQKNFEKSLKDLKKNEIYGILLHNSEDINFKNIEKFFKIIDEYKKQKLIKKFGYSTYGFDNLYKFQKKYPFDIIQSPINLFCLNNKIIEKVKKFKKKNKVEIHGRSAFLQGLALESPSNLNNYFAKLKKKLFLIESLSKKKNISTYSFILSNIKSFNIVDVLFIGVTSVEEYKQLIKFKYKKLSIKPNQFYINDNKITDPRNWPYD